MTVVKPPTAATLECDMCGDCTLHRRVWRESKYKCTKCGCVNKRLPARRSQPVVQGGLVIGAPMVREGPPVVMVATQEQADELFGAGFITGLPNPVGTTVHVSHDDGKTWTESIVEASAEIEAALDDDVDEEPASAVESIIDAEHEGGRE